ncbi:hypothetical protein [Paenibacillus agaridevorans]|uniref:hypothetical protein n=1 Tax=Paenibacillus agaridevorans TaxID=171404 RepID=UPI001BE42668|nr:hypothetical protein [Paenibacillus agaridevorans]
MLTLQSTLILLTQTTVYRSGESLLKEKQSIPIVQRPARDELYMLPDGSWHIGKAPANAIHAVQGSPRILKDGKSFTAESVKRDLLADSSWKGKSYRVAGGVTAEGRLVSARTLDKVDMDTLEGIMLACTRLSECNIWRWRR